MSSSKSRLVSVTYADQKAWGIRHKAPPCAWSFYILLVTFMGMSPGGARESSPWREPWEQTRTADRKSTRLNSSHANISPLPLPDALPIYAWSFYILLVTFMGMSPGGAQESTPGREPWEQTRT